MKLTKTQVEQSFKACDKMEVQKLKEEHQKLKEFFLEAIKHSGPRGGWSAHNIEFCITRLGLEYLRPTTGIGSQDFNEKLKQSYELPKNKIKIKRTLTPLNKCRKESDES